MIRAAFAARSRMDCDCSLWMSISHMCATQQPLKACARKRWKKKKKKKRQKRSSKLVGSDSATRRMSPHEGHGCGAHQMHIFSQSSGSVTGASSGRLPHPLRAEFKRFAACG